MDINDLKQSWQQMGARLDRLEIEQKLLERRLAGNELKSSAEKLADRYRCNAFIGWILPILAPTVVIVLKFSMLTAILYAVFGIIMSGLNLTLYRYAKRDLNFSLPVIDTLRNALQLRKLNRLVLISGIVMGCSIIGLFGADIMELSQGDASYNAGGVLLGMAVGFIVGLPIGIRKTRAQTRLIRRIIDDLSSIAETEDQIPAEDTF